jgi:alkyl sulfatase BDS1-like metallo-beta-lactamase superfamily hydrolase
MSTNMLADARRLMTGEIETGEWFRSVPPTSCVALDEHSAVIVCRGLSGNVTALRTSDGLVLSDSGSVETAGRIFDALRAWEPNLPVHTILYTHGHFDHAFGARLYDLEANKLGRARPSVVAHANVARRFDRYGLTAQLNRAINARQYSRPEFEWPSQYREPDLMVHDRAELTIGGERFECIHDRGETDDHLWLWAPERRLITTGDFVMWAAPNAGNPQKVQRYAGDWARALRAMAERRPEILVPGHGPPIVGAALIEEYLDATARWLESLHDQTVELLNAGRRTDEIVGSVRVPQDLADKPWLQPTYDDPEFVVRGICRLYGGWWDGNPAHLKPAPAERLAGEIAHLAGGADRLATRALALLAEGDERLAGHLAEFAAAAAPDNPVTQRARAEVNEARSRSEPSQMAKGIFRAAARESGAKAQAAERRR